jgi:peptide/nickel transport system permease protein
MTERIQQIAEQAQWGSGRDRGLSTRRYIARNPSLVVGSAMLLFLAAFSGLGRLFVDVSTAAPLSGPASSPPSPGFPFGVDAQGRNLIAAAPPIHRCRKTFRCCRDAAAWRALC